MTKLKKASIGPQGVTLSGNVAGTKPDANLQTMSRTSHHNPESPEASPSVSTPSETANPQKYEQAHNKAKEQPGNIRDHDNKKRAEQPDPNMDSKSGILVDAWARLKEQQIDFEQRSLQLGALRQRLKTYLDQQNRLTHLRQRELEQWKLKNDRQHDYLKDAKLHLRRFMKEHGQQLERLKAKEREIADYGESIEGEVGDTADDVVSVTQPYQEKIDELIREKLEIQQRLEVLQQQIQVHVLEEATPTRAGLPSPSGWHLGIALLAGLIVATVLVLQTTFNYEIRMKVVADPSKISSPQSLEEHISDLTQALSYVSMQPGSPIANALPAVHSNPGGNSFDLCAIAEDRSTNSIPLATQQLLQTAELYFDQLETNRLRSIAKTQGNINEIENQIILAKAEHLNVITKMDDKRLVVVVDNPKEELERLRAELAIARADFEQTQSEIRAAEKELNALMLIEIPNLPEVDAQTREQVESQDNYLKQDLEALRFRLGQLHKHLLKALNHAAVPLSNYVTAVQELAAFLDTQKLNLSNRKVMAAVDDVRVRAGEFVQLILEFEKRWDRSFQSLQRLLVDPRRQECLKIQRSLEEAVKDFDDDCNDVLDAVQLEYQNLIKSFDNPAEYFGLRNGLVKAIREVKQKQLAFHKSAQKVLCSGDVQLEAILHPIVGLTRRVRDRRASIENKLSLNKHQTMEKELAAEIQQQQAQLKAQRDTRNKTMAHLLQLQEQLDVLLPYIAEHGATTSVILYTPEKADKLMAKKEQLEREMQKQLRHLEELKSIAHPLSIHDPQASVWPVNILARSSQVGFGGMAATVIAYLLLMLGDKSYRLIAGKSTKSE